MSGKYFLIIVLLALILGMLNLVRFSVNPQAASGYDKYIWEYYSPQNLAPETSSLKTKLEGEVQKIVAAGHLAPYRALYGEIQVHYFWYHHYDVVYTLALAYPYLSADLQTQVKTYLQAEMQNYPLWDETYLDSKTGTRREPDLLTAPEVDPLPNDYRTRPKMFALYALWLYAQNTQDWSYVETNWNAIKDFYSRNHLETAKYYSAIGGAIGMARLAQQKPNQDAAQVSAAVADITVGMDAGKNLLQFGQNAEAVYQWINGGWDWTKLQIFLGFHFLELSPEIGRYMYDDSTLKGRVIGSQSDFPVTSDQPGVVLPEAYYTLRRGEYFYPLWYMAHSPGWSRYFGEGSNTPPDAKAMIFPLKAWLLKESASKLQTYLDIPETPIGDFYYIQNLVYTIQAYGTECWNNILNAPNQCGPLNGPPDLWLGMTHGEHFTAGLNGIYLLTIKNIGATSTSGTLTLSQSLPAGLSFVSVVSSPIKGTNWNCSATGQPVTITCTNTGKLGPGESALVPVVVAVSNSASGSLTSTATVTTPQDSNAANNSASNTVTIETTCTGLVVSGSYDDGSGTMCGTLSYALAHAPPLSTISFGRTGTFTLLAPLAVSFPSTGITIDGGCTLDAGRGVPNVRLTGGAQSGPISLVVSSNATLNGLAFTAFSGYAVEIQGSGNRLTCDWFGTADGLTAAPNGGGVKLAAGASNNNLGQAGHPEKGNLISGNTGSAILIAGGNNNALYYNWLGLKKTGLHGLKNQKGGIIFSRPSQVPGYLKLVQGNRIA